MRKRQHRRGYPSEWLNTFLAGEHEGCVDWPFRKHKKGYGALDTGGRERRVTHVVLERVGQPRPPAPRNMALHSCDHPSCINPKHLSWGTGEDNNRQMYERGRGRMQGGLWVRRYLVKR